MHSFGRFEVPFWQYAVKVLAVLCGLLGVLLLGVHLLKKFRLARLGPPSRLRILETHYLTPKTSLHLVAVGPAKFLVGSAGERLTLLTALPPDQLEAQEGTLTEGVMRPLAE